MLISQESTVVDRQSEGETTFRQFGDAELLDAWARDQHPDAFAALVSRHGPMVLSVCRRRCQSAEDADDAYQTTFLHLARSAGKIRRPECLPGWLQRVAQRAASATLSDRYQTRETMADAVAEQTDPLGQITQRHEAIVLDEELAELPEHYRTAIVLHLYEGFPLARLAEQLSTSLGTIRGRLQRGKRMLAGRLRRRGIVPIMAFAAAGASTATMADSAAASQPLLASISSGTVPPAPIEPKLLDTFLHTGTRVMNPWNLIGGLTAAGTISAMLMIPGPGKGDVPSGDPVSVTVAEQPPLVAQIQVADPAPAANPETNANGNQANGGEGNQAAPQRMVWERQYKPREATGPIAESIREALDQEVDIDISVDVKELAESLETQTQVPVIIDGRALEFAEVDLNRRVIYSAKQEPLRTALRKILQPLGLKAVVQNEALFITADHSELVHRGIGTDMWLTVDDDFMKQIRKKLSQDVAFTFIETPMSDAVETISQTLDLPLIIDDRAMEEIGLDPDAGVTIDLKGISAHHFLRLMLRAFDMTVTMRDNVVVLTTVEAARENMLGRIYWLEGIHLAGDYDSLINLIQTTIEPDTWEAMGGNATLAPFGTTRPAIVVSNVYDMHLQIEDLINAFRKSSFGEEAEMIDVQVPERPGGFGFGGGLGGGGMGGGGGGFM